MDVPPQPLGLNQGRYHGEPLALPATLDAIERAARRHRWNLEWLEAGSGVRLPALSRIAPQSHRGVYLSSGIHGDEPAGPLAILQLLEANQWPAHTSLWICPCLNPSGLELNQRENASGIDLNRDYRDPKTGEIRAHLRWLRSLPSFDTALCLHEDWEARGFYLYELNLDGRPSDAEAAIRAVAPLCPIDSSPMIDDRPARGGIIRPQINLDARPDWPEAFLLVREKTRHSYTLESPSDFALPARVAALKTATRALLGVTSLGA